MNDFPQNQAWVHQTKHLLGQSVGWNHALTAAMLREVGARALGVSDPEKYGALPPGSTTVIINGAETTSAPLPVQKPAPAKAGWLGKIGLFGAIIGAGALGAGATKIPIGTSPTVAAPAPVVSPVIAMDGAIIQEQKQVDGTWKFLWSLPAKLLPDGSAQTLDGRRWQKGPDGWTQVQ